MLRVFLLGIFTTVLVAQDGATVYQTHCAACHDAAAGRVPRPAALRAMSSNAILDALDNGVMKTQAAGMTEQERKAVAMYLGKPAVTRTNTAAGSCGPEKRGSVPSRASTAWSSWGADAANSRFQDAAAAGLSPAQVPKLRLKWAFGLGEGTAPHSQPVVALGRVFVGASAGTVYSLDAQTGCTYWAFQADAPVRSGLVFGATNDKTEPAVFFADQKANVYAAVANTGRLLWKAHVDKHFAALVTGTPALHEGVLYVPISSFEEAIAGSPKYECCTFRGSVVALNASTGAQIWKTYTIASPAQATGVGRTGSKLRGPSGAAVWSTPTFDQKRDRLYTATGDNYSDPPTDTSDAILALDAKTGKLLWSRQATRGDVFNNGCGTPAKTNCPPAPGHDFDFAQPPILVPLGNGQRALVVGQKSGFVHGFDPDDEGKPLWNKRFGEGGPLGGIMWGSAADHDHIYVAVSDVRIKAVGDSSVPQGYRLDLDPAHGGGLFALKAATGDIAWATKPFACGDRKNCSPAQSAPISAIPGVVFSGSLDGHLRAYAADTGAAVWDVDTAAEYDTVNGKKGRGGSLDVTGPVIAEGRLYLTSGYGQWGGMPGNVLLAYSVEGR